MNYILTFGVTLIFISMIDMVGGCYVTTLFGNDSYLEGVLLVALGLIRQGSLKPRIILITRELETHIELLTQFFDEVHTVGKISSGDSDIRISKRIQSVTPCGGDINAIYMTKIHIFRKSLVPYDKAVFIDADLIPVQNFDKLFDMPSPSGWLEANNGKIHYWGEWGFKQTPVPRKLTDLMNRYSYEINTGLLVIEPNDETYTTMLRVAKDPNILDKRFWGYYENPNKLVKGYSRTDQQFITQYFSGQWNYISGKYNAWGNIKDINGLHMAGLRRQVGKNKINTKTWMIQTNDPTDIYDTITNKLVIWGLNKYPILRSIFFRDLKLVVQGKLISIHSIDPSLCTKELQEIKLLLKME